MKKLGYEVIALRPVCVDFEDGRSVSFRPGTRFECIPSNQSVVRLLRTRSIRELSAIERVPALPVKLGAPKQVRDVLKARSEVAAARKKAEAKMAASKAAPPRIEVAKPAPKKKD